MWPAALRQTLNEVLNTSKAPAAQAVGAYLFYRSSDAGLRLGTEQEARWISAGGYR